MIPGVLLLLSLVARCHGSSLGLGLGSTAAGNIATYSVRSMLQQPRQMYIELQSGVGPWFEPIAHVDTKNRIGFESLNIRFHDDLADARIQNVTLRSESKVHILPLPFFLGEDIVHTHADIPNIHLRLKMEDFHLKVHECNLKDSSLDMWLEHSYFLNLILVPMQRLLPNTLVHDGLCNSIANAFSSLRSKFAFELPLRKLLPDKLVPYMLSPNITLFTQLQTVEAQDDKLTLSATIEWSENAGDTTRMSRSDQLNDQTSKGSDEHESFANSNGGRASSDGSSTAKKERRVFQPMERLQIWLDDHLLNEVFERFRWDFVWMDEEIPVESPKLPQDTRDFLTTLCANCYFHLVVSAKGHPSVTSINSSIVLEKTDGITLTVINPSQQKTAVFVSFQLTLSVQLVPKIEDGIFRTAVDLLETDIKMEKGAFPNGWNTFVQDLVKGMIMDVVWPNLQREIETLTYGDGVEIPAVCGLEPESAQLHFDEGRIGASAVLRLSEFSMKNCVQQMKLPDPSKLFLIKGAA